MELLRHVATQPGRLVLVVTHDSRIFPYGDRMVEMDDGRITAVTKLPAGDASAAGPLAA
jgi:putative ABC transport system ATP-binding protein